MTGASLVPVMVTVIVCESLSLSEPESSVDFIWYLSTSVSPSPRKLKVSLLELNVQLIVPVFESFAIVPLERLSIPCKALRSRPSGRSP